MSSVAVSAGTPGTPGRSSVAAPITQPLTRAPPAPAPPSGNVRSFGAPPSTGDFGAAPPASSPACHGSAAPVRSQSPPGEVPFCETVPEDLACGICFQAAADPVVTEECGHLFCRECITMALDRKKECPIDRSPLTVNELRKDVRTYRKVMALNVFCLNKRGGCQWKGAYSDLEKHCERCDFAPMRCPFAAHGCEYAATRKNLTEHLNATVAQHLLYVCATTTRLVEENTALQQEVDLMQRDDQRFVWVIPNFEAKKGPVYSRKFSARGLMWYLGVDFEGPDQHAGVYLFAEGHQRRVDFKLILHNVDPQRDKVHIVNDWASDYKGKGWGPLKFIDRATIAQAGFVVNGCVRVATEIDSDPFE